MTIPPPENAHAPDAPETMQEAPVGLDPQKVQEALDRLRAEQNLLLGAGAGAVAAAIGAILWAVVTVATGWQIGYMALAVGFLVGVAVRIFGKGIEKPFQYVGAGLSLLGCLVGNILAICGFFAKTEGISVLSVLGGLNSSIIQNLMVETFKDPFNLLFYGIAVYEGYKFSRRNLTLEDIQGPSSEEVAPLPD